MTSLWSWTLSRVHFIRVPWDVVFEMAPLFLFSSCFQVLSVGRLVVVVKGRFSWVLCKHTSRWFLTQLTSAPGTEQLAQSSCQQSLGEWVNEWMNGWMDGCTSCFLLTVRVSGDLYLEECVFPYLVYWLSCASDHETPSNFTDLESLWIFVRFTSYFWSSRFLLRPPTYLLLLACPAWLTRCRWYSVICHVCHR